MDYFDLLPSLGGAHIFDTHAHYDDEAFAADRDELLERIHAYGVSGIVTCAYNEASAKAALELAHRYDFIYAAVGLHPENTDEGYREDRIRAGLEDSRCVAVGEIGLDYHWHEPNEVDLAVFEGQIKLALEYDKPVIVHDREAHGDSFDIVCRYPALRGVFHCYSGSAEMAAELLKRGWYLGFDGPITYKNARKALEVLQMCPLERMVIETDSPYLTPVPNRGKRNDSSNLKYVIDKIAEVKGVSASEIERATFENGKKLFGMEDM